MTFLPCFLFVMPGNHSFNLFFQFLLHIIYLFLNFSLSLFFYYQLSFSFFSFFCLSLKFQIRIFFINFLLLFLSCLFIIGSLHYSSFTTLVLTCFCLIKCNVICFDIKQLWILWIWWHLFANFSFIIIQHQFVVLFTGLK